MCDFSLQAFKSRPAIVGEKLVTRNFGAGTTGFCSPQDTDCAVCILPGTELAFDAPVQTSKWTYYGIEAKEDEVYPSVAKFTQVNKEVKHAHHDQLEFPDGQTLLLTNLSPGQTATVLQLPAAPKTEEEIKEQTRAEFVG